MQFWAKHPGMLRRMTWADETAGLSPLTAHLEWPSAEEGEDERSAEGAPAVRRLLLGQLSDDQASDPWEDERPGSQNLGGDRPADPPDAASDFEGFELQDPDATHADDNEQPLTSAADDPTAAATRPVPLAAGRETDGVAPERRARGPRSRIAIVAAGVIALVVGTAVYVGTRGTPEDQRGRRPTSTSLERQSASTGTPVTTASSDPAPDTEPALASNASPGSAAPASRQTAPKGTGSTQSGAPATPTAGVGSPPPAASNGPNASPPPPPPTPAPSTSPNPVCQITPQLCP